MTVREWKQNQFTRPGRMVQQQPTDFYDSNGLYPDPHLSRLARLPGWSSHVAWEEDFERPYGAYYERDNDYFVFVGRLSSNSHLAALAYDRDWAAVAAAADLALDVSAYQPLGGIHQQSVCRWGGYTWYLTGATVANLYRGQGAYTVAPSLFTSAQASDGFDILLPYGDRMFAITHRGRVYRLGSANTAMELFYSAGGGSTEPQPDLTDIVYATPYHQYLALVAVTSGGGLRVYRLPDVSPLIMHDAAQAFDVAGRLPAEGETTPGLMFATLNDVIYMCSGYYRPEDEYRWDFYAFDGIDITHRATFLAPPDESTLKTAGLLLWRNHLVLYYNSTFYINVGDRFVAWASLTSHATRSSYSAAYAMADQIACVCKSSAGNEGFYHLDGLMDGYVITSWLDMDRPGKLKTLHKITVVLDRDDADFDVTVSYRTDNASTWTAFSAVADQHIIVSAPVKTQFYLLQIKVALADDSGDDLDIGIVSISATYDEQDR